MLELDVPWLDNVVRAKRPQRVPVVLTREEVRAVLRPLIGVPRLMASLPYGSGLRLLECCRLHVQGIDFATNQMMVRGAKGDKDRVTVLPAAIKLDLARNLERVHEQHRQDVQNGAGWVELPTTLGRKYPNAGRKWVWQWVFPATRLYRDRITSQLRRHHLHESVLQRIVKDAVRRAGIAKRATPHTLPFLRDPPAGRRPRYPDRPGTSGSRGVYVAASRDVTTTQIYTHVLNPGPSGVRSPADGMPEA